MDSAVLQTPEHGVVILLCEKRYITLYYLQWKTADQPKKYEAEEVIHDCSQTSMLKGRHICRSNLLME